MKKLIIIILTVLLPSLALAEEKRVDCKSPLAKLKPDCNFIGSGVKSLKVFSNKHKTIGQSLEKSEKIKNFKQLSKEKLINNKAIKSIKEIHEKGRKKN